MAKPLSELREKIKPEVRTAARSKAIDIITEMTLADVRKTKGVSQFSLAQILKIAQPNVSQIEKRPDNLVSTLKQYIEALGGHLEIHAKFPDGDDIQITHFDAARV